MRSQFRAYEGVAQRRTQAERAAERRGINLREADLAPLTLNLYRAAFISLWTWIGVPPPEIVIDGRAYDQLLPEFIHHCWVIGHTRALGGNALSSSLAAYPELRGQRILSESWNLLNTKTTMEIPSRAPPMPPIVCLALIAFFVLREDWEGALLLLKICIILW